MPLYPAALGSHGAASHTDLARVIWLAAEDATVDAGVLTTYGTAPDALRAVALADAATQGAFWTFILPADWAANLTVTPVWLPVASDAVAHTVQWSMNTRMIPSANTATAAGTTVAFTGASAVRTALTIVNDTATSTSVTQPVANAVVRLNLRRLGADVLDSYVGVVGLVGVIITYTATQ